MAPRDDKKPPQQPPKPKAGEFGSGFDRGPRTPSRSSEISLPKPLPAPKAPARPLLRRGPPGKKPGPPQVMTTFQKQQLGSGFVDSAKHQKRQTVIGSNPALFNDDDDDDEVTLGRGTYDGLTAPAELTGRDVWKVVQAPLQSKPSRRARALYEQVLKQFAVASNPRYAPDASGGERSHIFVWDVSLAMNCEIPHFSGAKENNLSQTTDWVRHVGPMRGWVRVNSADIYDVAARGQLVVVVPKDPRQKGIAIVHPQPRALAPVVVSGGTKRGWGISLREALGVVSCEYFTHP